MDRRAVLIKDDGALGASLGLLPRSVRFLGASPAGDDGEAACGLYEFEVVSGNAAYREGERFYLTPTQAQKAYPAASL
jgi:hypothetical protein